MSGRIDWVGMLQLFLLAFGMAFILYAIIIFGQNYEVLSEMNFFSAIKHNFLAMCLSFDTMWWMMAAFIPTVTFMEIGLLCDSL